MKISTLPVTNSGTSTVEIVQAGLSKHWTGAQELNVVEAAFIQVK